MYRQFVRNLEYFLELNYSDDTSKNYRYEIAKSIEALSDINKFLELKDKDIEKFKEISNLIWELEENSSKYPSFKTLSWELWGYGFDGEKHTPEDNERLKEQLKTIDLSLGTKYWH